uniref:Putative LOC100120931 [Nasonia vitripennis] n=1 Tax=Lepeophtheirus salmonis TaxID=72036 RepID=A0A0K2VGB5_LEPSM
MLTEMNQSDGNITLDCHAKCADPCDIYWYLNQTKFSRLTNVTKFTRKREGYSLYSIESKVDLNCRDYASSNVSVSYTCRVLSRDAESIQTTARIKVYYPPKNIVTFRSIQNRQSTLQCYVDANPKAEYIWYDSSGKILSKKAKFIWTDDDAESKHVLGPTSITCKAFNTYGSLLSSMKLDPSNSTSSCHIQKTEFENDYVELNCESGGSDKFIWYFNGETLIELNESKIIANQYGYYTCVSGESSDTSCTIYLSEKFLVSEKLYLFFVIFIIVVFFISLAIIFGTRFGHHHNTNAPDSTSNFENNINSDINSLIQIEAKQRRNIIISDTRQMEQIWLV